MPVAGDGRPSLHALLHVRNLVRLADDLHAADRAWLEIVDRQHGKDCPRHSLHREAREADQSTRARRPRHGLSGMVGIHEREIVAVAHRGKKMQEISGKNGVDALQHGSDPSAAREIETGGVTAEDRGALRRW